MAACAIRPLLSRTAFVVAALALLSAAAERRLAQLPPERFVPVAAPAVDPQAAAGLVAGAVLLVAAIAALSALVRAGAARPAFRRAIGGPVALVEARPPALGSEPFRVAATAAVLLAGGLLLASGLLLKERLRLRHAERVGPPAATEVLVSLRSGPPGG